jgi:hypothetical protein
MGVRSNINLGQMVPWIEGQQFLLLWDDTCPGWKGKAGDIKKK